VCDNQMEGICLLNDSSGGKADRTIPQVITGSIRAGRESICVCSVPISKNRDISSNFNRFSISCRDDFVEGHCHGSCYCARA
jgi:hypothetical protein